jgi:hypothetical protein
MSTPRRSDFQRYNENARGINPLIIEDDLGRPIKYRLCGDGVSRHGMLQRD